MIALLEEEYNSTSQKYVLHLTMGANDTVADLPSSTKPFDSSNYSCFFNYGEPAEESTAVNEVTGKLYTYSDGEWVEPQPAGETKVLVSGDGPYSVGDVPFSEDGYALCEPGDVVSGLNAEYHYYITAIDPETLNIVNLEEDMSGVTSYTIPDTLYLEIWIAVA